MVVGFVLMPALTQSLLAQAQGLGDSNVTVTADDLMQHLPRLIDHSDAPVAEASMRLMRAVSCCLAAALVSDLASPLAAARFSSESTSGTPPR